MSRSGNRPIPLPKGVEVALSGEEVTVKGPKGTLSVTISQGIQVEVKESQVFVSSPSKSSEMRPWHGLYRALICNCIVGTSQGFERKLELKGVGYRAAVSGNSLALQLGFSHPTELAIPSGLSVSVEKNTVITISGIDRQAVGQFAATVRAMRPPEPYKGKGVWYQGEYVRRKAGKSGKK